MTTHRPDTIIMAPAESLFEMRKDATPVVVPVRSKDEIVARLSGSAFAVIESRRIVYVEDMDDEVFHGKSYNIAVQQGSVGATPLLLFQRVSIGEGDRKIPGGREKVRLVTRQMHEHGLGSLIRGLIDRDRDNAESDGICVLSRYSWENYIVDPLVIVCAALEAEQRIVDVEGLPGLGKGDEYKIRELSAAAKQKIVDHVFDAVESTAPDLTDQARVVVAFGEQTLGYRRWIFETQGKTLLTRVQKKYQFASQRELLNAYLRLQMVPTDLTERYESLRMR